MIEPFRRAGETGDSSIDYDGKWTSVACGRVFQFVDCPAPFCNDPLEECDKALEGTGSKYTSSVNGANHLHK